MKLCCHQPLAQCNLNRLSRSTCYCEREQFQHFRLWAIVFFLQTTPNPSLQPQLFSWATGQHFPFQPDSMTWNILSECRVLHGAAQTHLLSLGSHTALLWIRSCWLGQFFFFFFFFYCFSSIPYTWNIILAISNDQIFKKLGMCSDAIFLRSSPMKNSHNSDFL